MDHGPKMDIGRAKEFKFGKMAASILATGKMIKQMEKEGSFMQMEMFTKENGRTTKHMVEEFMNILMELCT